MPQPPFIQRLKLKNFLSFDSTGVDVELRPLNILIGTNGSGKSNFLYAIKMLKSLPTGLWEFLREGGGLSEWQYKGGENAPIVEIDATLNLVINLPWIVSEREFQYNLGFDVVNDAIRTNHLQIMGEEITGIEDVSLGDPLYYQYKPLIAPDTVKITPQGYLQPKEESATSSTYRQSVFQYRKDEYMLPVLTQIGKAFERIGCLDLPFGKDAPYRKPQLAESFDEENLAPDGNNIAIVINNIQTFHPDVMDEILEKFKKILSRAKRIQTNTTSNLIRLFVHEVMGNKTVPISSYRLSDGTLRFLCLLVILLSPTPPPLICIEEPEIGMHPEMLLVIAELLKEASTRTQIIVTTHSDILLSAFTDTPEAILVCEHDGAKSSITRLDADSLSHWLEEYTLGDLWLRNVFGGMRNAPPVEV